MTGQAEAFLAAQPLGDELQCFEKVPGLRSGVVYGCMIRQPRLLPSLEKAITPPVGGAGSLLETTCQLN